MLGNSNEMKTIKCSEARHADKTTVRTNFHEDHVSQISFSVCE